jgi:hypothetical protein
MKRLLLAGVLAAALMAPATASAAPTGEFAKFAKCPYTNPVIFACVYAETTSGTFTIGNKTVPIKNPVILQGGVETVIPETLVGPLKFYGATDGNSLSKTPQPVPGGLLGITAPSWWPTFLKELFNETINNGFTGVTATVELAAPASSIELSLAGLLTQQGTALGLPVKVKLSNPFLGNSCYIGSNSNPIQLKLTSGTTSPPPPNTPISGSPGALEFEKPVPGILTDGGNRLVNNSFSAPGANGCGGILLSWAVDPFVDSILGTPSAAGRNTAILEGTTYLGAVAAFK